MIENELLESLPYLRVNYQPKKSFRYIDEVFYWDNGEWVDDDDSKTIFTTDEIKTLRGAFIWYLPHEKLPCIPWDQQY